MPNVSEVEFSVVVPCATETPSEYSGCAPSWYGRQICGEAMVSAGNADGANVTVLVEFAATVTACETVIGVPDPGGVTVAVTVPVCALAEVLVTSVLTVSALLDRSAAVAWFTCELSATSGPPVSSCTGNWMPVLLSGGICVQSTLSSVSIVFGSFGCISMASELVPDVSSAVMS